MDKGKRSAMKPGRVVAGLILCLGILGSVWGCYYLFTGRSPEQMEQDLAITEAVQEKLVADPFLSRFVIHVDAFRGKVTLMGTVDSLEAKNRAGELAATVEGVRRVDNRLRVEAKPKIEG